MINPTTYHTSVTGCHSSLTAMHPNRKPHTHQHPNPSIRLWFVRLINLVPTTTTAAVTSATASSSPRPALPAVRAYLTCIGRIFGNPPRRVSNSLTGQPP